MKKVIKLSDAIAEKKIHQVKPTEERKSSREQILMDIPDHGLKNLSLSEAAKTLEYKLAYCEDSFFKFTNSNFDEDDTLVFSAFLINHIRNVIDAIAFDEEDEQILICIGYLRNLSERTARTYLSALMK